MLEEVRKVKISGHYPTVWRDIPGYEGKYKLGSRGDVKSLARYVESGLFVHETILSFIAEGKSSRVYLSDKGFATSFRIVDLLTDIFPDYSRKFYEGMMEYKCYIINKEKAKHGNIFALKQKIMDKEKAIRYNEEDDFWYVAMVELPQEERVKYNSRQEAVKKYEQLITTL